MLSPNGAANRLSRLAARVGLLLVAFSLAVVGFTVSGPPVQAAPDADMAVSGLRTNGLVDPLGIELSDPVFSWQNTSSVRDVMQTAYEVRVAESEDSLAGAGVWSSGKMDSEEQLNVVYGGPDLASQTRYHWQVRTWNDHGAQSEWSEPAWFETALAPDEWTADWITGPGTDEELARWTDYTVTADFTIDNLVFGLTARAKDLNNVYMLQISVADGTPKFRPHRKVDGGWTLLENKDISSFTSVEELLTGQHELSVTFEGSTITTSLDGEQIDERTDATHAAGFVGFRQSVAQEGPEEATVRSIRVTSPTFGTLLDTDFTDGVNPFTGGSITPAGLELTSADEVIYQAVPSEPLLRKEFDLGDDIASARIYATARGVYELTINGEKVGDEQLAPGWTDYNKRIDYQTYDVTGLLAGGSNVFGAYLADGWYAGTIASFGDQVWGDETSLIAQLRIDYRDGTHEWVTTDSTWRTTNGPYTSADLIHGETYDERLNPAGWQESGFDVGDWSSATVARTSATTLLEPQTDEPVRVTERRPAITRTEAEPDTWIYDLGQNMVGVAQMSLTGQAGTTAIIRYGEMLNPDGTLYTANLRSAKVTDRYVFESDGTVEYTPKFTFHGYRYLEITGVTAPPAADEVIGIVWGSDLETIGDLSTSSDMLNQLQSNITWGQRGNFLSIPTDTPARDERLGWSGDINVFAPTASFNQYTLNFLSKWLVDLTDAQGADGNLPGIAPMARGCCGGGVGWSDAGITVPYALYNAFGDTRVITDHYVMMTKFMDYVEASAGESLLRPGGPYNDWLNLDDPTDGTLLGTAYFAHIAGLMRVMAEAIGEQDDARHYGDLSERVKEAFADRYIAADGTVSGNSQAGYAIAIGMDLVPDDQLKAVGDKYVAAIAARDYHLSTGFLGTPWLLPALTKTGHQDVAYRMLTAETYPSWGYEVASGATTMWERWDSLKPDGSFGDVEMNSFNHYAYGAVGEWMYQNIGGIAMTSPGYKTFEIAPSVGGGLTSATGTFDSAYGSITSQWVATDRGMTLGATVPVGTTATIRIPAANRFEITESGAALEDVEGIRVVSEDRGVVTLEAGSGEYRFDSDPAHSGLEVSIDAGGEVRAGETVTGHVRVTNPGTTPIRGFAAVLTTSPEVDLDPTVVSENEIAPGETADLLFAFVVPATLEPGDVEVTASISALVDSQLRQYSITAPLATVLPAITVDSVSVTPSSDDQPESARVEAELTNDSAIEITGRLVVDTPDGWQPATPSSAVTIPPGGTATARVVLAVPLTITAGKQNLPVRFVADGDTTLAEASTDVDIGLATPPAEFSDHIDLGESTSENAHNVQSSGQGGTTVEAGLTRRYGGIADGAWFSFEMEVEPNEPFILRAIETFDQPQVKGYGILVNGELVDSRLSTRTESGPGLATYQVLVPDDGTLTSSGRVTITMRFNGRGSHDPSIADAWTLPVSADTTPPSVTLEISEPGTDRWYRGGAEASLTAFDGRSEVASIEYRLDDGEWQTYDAPVRLPEGETLVTYRATDAAGNESPEQSETVRVDATAPTAWAVLAEDGSATTIAQDAGSGVARVAYSADGETWHESLTTLLAQDGAPATLHYRVTDRAGNTREIVAASSEATAPALVAGPAHIAGSGFEPGQTVRAELHPEPIVLLGTADADAAGVATLVADIPVDPAPAGRTLVLTPEEIEPGPGDDDAGGDTDGTGTDGANSDGTGGAADDSGATDDDTGAAGGSDGVDTGADDGAAGNSDDSTGSSESAGVASSAADGADASESGADGSDGSDGSDDTAAPVIPGEDLPSSGVSGLPWIASALLLLLNGAAVLTVRHLRTRLGDPVN